MFLSSSFPEKAKTLFPNAASQVGLEVEVGSVESVLAATVVEIERNQGRIANPGPKVGNIFCKRYILVEF